MIIEPSGLPNKCFTEIQLITCFVAQKAAEMGFSIQVIVPDEQTYIIRISSPSHKIILKILQIQKVFKLYVQNDNLPVHPIWFNHKSFVQPRMLNTFSRKSIINEKRLANILKSRVFRDSSIDHKSLPTFFMILDEQFLAVKILKYLPLADIKRLLLTSFTVYECCNKNNVFKALYEGKFGRTGFGNQLNWKTLYIKKVGGGK